MLISKSVSVSALLFGLLLSDLSATQADSGIRGQIIRSPESAVQGSEIRVEAGLFNGNNLPRSVRAQLWLIRPNGGATALGGKVVQLRPDQRLNLVIPGRIGLDAPVGPNRIALVIVTREGRWIADSKPIRIVARGSSAGVSQTTRSASGTRASSIQGPIELH